MRHQPDHLHGNLSRRLMRVYQRLLARYGPQRWWPGDGPFETIVGAILTQNTAWANVEKALANLKAAGALSATALREMPQPELARLLRPCGYFNIKARRLRAFAQHMAQYGDSLEALFAKEVDPLRRELLGIHGIGEETADDIVLYAAQKPSFVVDAYTRRILGRLGLAPHRETYQAYKDLFEENLPSDVPLFNEYHALLDRHAKETCRTRPLCHGCCLLSLCPTGRAAPHATPNPGN